MNLAEGQKRRGVPVENYPLVYSRSDEIGKVLELVDKNPIVFVWAPAGNGKTGFAREFRVSIPDTRHILPAQLGDSFEVPEPFDERFDDGN